MGQTAREQRVIEFLVGHGPQFLETRCLGLRPVLERELSVCLPAPRGESLSKRCGGADRVTLVVLSACRVDRGLEAGGIDRIDADAEAVATLLRDDERIGSGFGAAERFAEPSDVAADRGRRTGRGRTFEHDVEESIGGRHFARVQDERREQPPLAGTSQVDDAVDTRHPNRAEYFEFHRRLPLRPTLPSGGQRLNQSVVATAWQREMPAQRHVLASSGSGSATAEPSMDSLAIRLQRLGGRLGVAHREPLDPHGMDPIMHIQNSFDTADEVVGNPVGNGPGRGGPALENPAITRVHRLAVLAAATLIGVVSACASDGDEGQPQQALRRSRRPRRHRNPSKRIRRSRRRSRQIPPPTAPIETTATTSEPVETDPPPATVAVPEPKRLLAGTMSGGTTFVAAFMEPQVTFTIPEDHGPQSWSAIRLDQEGFVILALQDAPTPGVPADYEPGAGVTLVSEGATIDDVVASVTAYAEANDDFDVTVESGQFRGEEVTVLRANSSRIGGFVDVPTSSDSGFGFPDGPRRFVAYLIEGPDQVVLAHFDSHELDYDFMVDRATPVLESIEFL